MPKSSDVRVLETGEKLPFGEESRLNRRRVHIQVEKLECHLLIELAIDARSAIDDPHAAMTEGAVERPGTDTSARPCCGLELDGSGRGYPARENLEEPVGLVVGSEELLQVAVKSRVIGTLASQEASALSRGKLECRREQGLAAFAVRASHLLRQARIGGVFQLTEEPGAGQTPATLDCRR